MEGDIFSGSVDQDLVVDVFSNATGVQQEDIIEIRESRTGIFSPTPESVLGGLQNDGIGIAVYWYPEFLGGIRQIIHISPEQKPNALNEFYSQRMQILQTSTLKTEEVFISFADSQSEIDEIFNWVISQVPQNIQYNMVISDLVPDGDLEFIIPPFENKRAYSYFNEAYEAYMASYQYPTETFNLNYTGSSYQNDVNTIKTGYNRNQTLIINLSNLLPSGDVLSFQIPPFEAANYDAYLQAAYDSFMASYQYPEETFSLAYGSSDYMAKVADIKTNYNRNQVLLINVSQLLPAGNVLSFEIPPFEASNYDAYLSAAYNEFMSSYVYPDETLNLNYTGSNYASNIDIIKSSYNRNGVLIINVSNVLPEGNVLTFEIPPFGAENYDTYFQNAYEDWMSGYQPPVTTDEEQQPDYTIPSQSTITEDEPIVIPEEVITTTEEIISSGDDVVITGEEEIGDILEDELIETLNYSGLTGGGGGAFAEEPVAETISDEGYLQKLPKGIQITGYVYPYLFLIITAAGGAAGFLVARYFKQSTLSMLALIAAGLMGGSAISMKVKPPVKV